MRPRIGQILKVGDTYKEVCIKMVQTISGAQCPTKAFYDNGQVIQNTDKVQRLVLKNGFIHYIKL